MRGLAALVMVGLAAVSCRGNDDAGQTELDETVGGFLRAVESGEASAILDFFASDCDHLAAHADDLATNYRALADMGALSFEELNAVESGENRTSVTFRLMAVKDDAAEPVPSYLLGFSWEHEVTSLARVPLVKEEDGWKVADCFPFGLGR